MGISMNSLGESLRSEGGGGGGGSGGGLSNGGSGGGEEWDAVRKEVRAIKGLLLNRRSFAHVNNAQPV